MRRSAVGSFLLLSLLSSCTDELTDESPTGTLTLFLAAMERSEHEEDALEEAYRLLSRETQRALAERAHMAGSLGGREFQPWEMLVRGRQRPNFPLSPRGRGLRARIDGEHAVVTATSADGSQHADVPLILEDGHWRIEVTIPPIRDTPSPPPPE